MSFLIENLYLVVIAVVSGGLLLWPLVRRGSGSAALSPLEATQLINHRNAVIVDLRDEKAFALGSLAGARHLPESELDGKAADLSRFKSRPLLVVCGTGQRSTKALATFTAQGFTEVHSLAGGIAAWTQAALPLVKAGRAPVAKEPVRNRKHEQRLRQKALATTVVEPLPAVPANDANAADPSADGALDTTPAETTHAAVHDAVSPPRAKEVS